MQRPDLNKDNLGAHGDEIYSILMQAHEGLSEDESHALNIRLVLIMANQIADETILEQIVKFTKVD